MISLSLLRIYLIGLIRKIIVKVPFIKKRKPFLRSLAHKLFLKNTEMVVAEEKQFLCGVVEGFYGRPWTCDQRKELFSRMRVSSMNTYIYAPKDDMKHRALWRQLYTKPEEMKIKHLIDAARAEDTMFVYAISPGLDISFASSADVTALKRKMKQVSKLGCTAFALLFDDINPMLKPSDAAVFKSSAHAQASVTNEVYTYLKEPKFLFCPTGMFYDGIK